MTNTNPATMFRPILTTPCTECDARIDEACAYDVPVAGVPAGMVAYRGPGEHNRDRAGWNAPGAGPGWEMIHTSRMKQGRVARAERLPSALKAGEKALAVSDDAVPTAKSARCYVAVGYRSMGGEALAFIAGPMTPAAAAALRKESGAERNVVPFDAVPLTSDQVEACRADGHVRGIGRLVVLPSQRGADGIERCEDAADAGEIVQPEAIVPRLAGRVVQADWLDAIAV